MTRLFLFVIIASVMKQLLIQAKARKIFGKQNQRLRRQGRLPAVLYGQGKESMALEIGRDEFEKIYQQAGESTLVDLIVEGGMAKKVLIHDVARHFMKDEPIHVDFYEVDLTRKITVPVALHFTGESAAVKELGGILVKNITEVEVEALPTDLPHALELDISKLKAFEDVLRLSDIPVSDNVKILGNPEEVAALIQPPRTEEELKELEEPVTAEAEKEAVAAVAGEEKAEGEPEAEEAKAEATEETKTEEKKEEPEKK